MAKDPSLVFVEDENSFFSLEAIQFRPKDLDEEDGELWSLNFSVHGDDWNLKTKPQKTTTINCNGVYETYKDALLDGIEISNLLGFNSAYPNVLIWKWNNEDELEIFKEISMDQVLDWYIEREPSICESNLVEQAMAEKEELPKTAIN